jgi:iron complex transport system ATP-binding protein
MIDVHGLEKRMNGAKVLDDVNFSMEQGLMYGIIGPNGAGKSTLLGILSGVEPYQSGSVTLRGKAVGAYKGKELAKWVAVLRQEGLPATLFTVRETVGMGRFPFQNWLGHDEQDADRLIDRALSLMGLSALADRSLDQLSGGERQRVAIAKVMVQEPELIFLDEPTTYLDIGYQVQLLDTIRQWQRESRLTVVAVLHDLNLASQYCDRLLVLKNGKVAAFGTPHEVLTESTIQDVYGTQPLVLPHPVSGTPQVLLQPQAEKR